MIRFSTGAALVCAILLASPVVAGPARGKSSAARPALVDCVGLQRRLTEQVGEPVANHLIATWIYARNREEAACDRLTLRAERTDGGIPFVDEVCPLLPPLLSGPVQRACEQAFTQRCLAGVRSGCAALTLTDAPLARAVADRCVEQPGPWCDALFASNFRSNERLCERGRVDGCLSVLARRGSPPFDRRVDWRAAAAATQRLCAGADAGPACDAAEVTLLSLEPPESATTPTVRARVERARRACAARKSQALCGPLFAFLLRVPGLARSATAADPLVREVLPLTPVGTFESDRARCEADDLDACDRVASFLSDEGENQAAADAALERAARERACRLDPQGLTTCLSLALMLRGEGGGPADLSAALVVLRAQAQRAVVDGPTKDAADELEAALKRCSGPKPRCGDATSFLIVDHSTQARQTGRAWLEAACAKGSAEDCTELLSWYFHWLPPDPKEMFALEARLPSAGDQRVAALREDLATLRSCERGDAGACRSAGAIFRPQPGKEGQVATALSQAAIAYQDRACAAGLTAACFDALEYREDLVLNGASPEVLSPGLSAHCLEDPRLCFQYLDRDAVPPALACEGFKRLCASGRCSPACDVLLSWRASEPCPVEVDPAKLRRTANDACLAK